MLWLSCGTSWWGLCWWWWVATLGFVRHFIEGAVLLDFEAGQSELHETTSMLPLPWYWSRSKVFHWHIAARCSKHWRWCITTITTTNTMILMNVVGRGSSKAYDLPPICHYHGVRQSICWDVSVYIHGRTIHHIHSSSSTTKPCHVLSLRPLTLIMNSMSDCRPSGWDYTTGQIRKHRREACRA